MTQAVIITDPEQILANARKMFTDGLNRETPNWETTREQLDILTILNMGDNEFVKAHKERLARDKIERDNMAIVSKLFTEEK